MYIYMHALYVCIYVCMHACMYVCIHTCIHTYVYIHVHTARQEDEGGAAEGVVAVGAKGAVVGEGGELFLALLDGLHSEGLRVVWLLEHCPPRVTAGLRLPL
jgi:hypothetical protein